MIEKKPITSQTTPTLPASLQYIVGKLTETKSLRPSQMVKIIREANVRPEELEPWADFDHPVEDSYGRKLVYKGGHFEIMVMSWRPGDFSAIHDHGHTQWGAVQIFGPAEHATFRTEDGYISTLNRWQVKAGDIVGVSHSLTHQMGNPTSNTFFLSLHVYGDVQEQENVTGDARIYELYSGNIQRVDGGVFFAIPQTGIKKLEQGPLPDFPTRLRHMVELIRRLRKIENHQGKKGEFDLEAVISDAFSADHHKRLLRCLEVNTDANDHQSNSVYWRALNRELQEAARLQNEINDQQNTADHFHKYAELYDALICQPCMDNFMNKYLYFFEEKYQQNMADKTLISLGCGTGLVEQFMIDNLGVSYENLYGIDISESMVQVARKRIQADEGDVLALDPGIRMWDMAFSGLNVFHYLDHRRLEEAIQKTASIIKSGGYFIGDFITPDHIRWYPNVVYSADKKIISLRTPRLIEQNGSMFQESEIINIDYRDEMRINYAGKHKRFLPPLHRVRQYFQQAFKGEVHLYDAISLKPISEMADSCKSTRYVLIARKE